MENRTVMLSALKEHTFPLLKTRGFVGKYPNFRRKLENCIELISFQTNKSSGSFTVEVSAVFPHSSNKNFTLYDGVTEDTVGVEATNERYRLPGMYDGWFYYRDVYRKWALFFGHIYYDVPEKESAAFVPQKGYKLVQKFDAVTAIQICEQLNQQLETAYIWLENFRKNHQGK